MKSKLSIILLIMLILSSIPITIDVRADDPSSFELLPNSDNVDIGEIFNISVYVSPNASINCIAIDELTFDPTLLNIVAHNATDNVSQGNIFESGTTLLWRSGVINNTEGNLTDVSWVTTPAHGGEGYFCNITFEALAVGIAYVNLTDVAIVYDINEWDYQILSNATITIGINVTTNEATGVEETNATLNGYINNPSDLLLKYGFNWGTTASYGNNLTFINMTFSSNNTIDDAVGIDSQSILDVFKMNGVTYMIIGAVDGQFEGYHWNATGCEWETNASIVSGLDDVGSDSAPTIFNISDVWFLIAGESTGVFNGYEWNGTAWETNNSIITGLGDIGGNSVPCTFYMNGVLYLIAGEYNGYSNGFEWNGTSWVVNDTIRSGIGDVGAYSTPTVFNIQGNYFLISGESTGVLNGWNWTEDTWESNSLYPGSDVGDDSAPNVFYINDSLYLLVGEANTVLNGWDINIDFNGTFSYDLTGLSEGTLYHYRAFMNQSGSVSNGLDETFLTKPNAPEDFQAIAWNTTVINLTWSKGDGANNTVVVHKTTGYPSSPADGSIVYNGTAEKYDHTIVEGTTNYYSAWSFSKWGTLHQWSDTNDSDIGKYIDFSLIIFVNSTTSIEEEAVKLNGYVASHDATYADVGFVYDTEIHTDIDDWTYNFTAEEDIANYTEFDYTAVNLQPGEYYYVKSWLHIYYQGTHLWNQSSDIEYFLTKPESPSNLTVTDIGDTNLTLEWDKTTDVGSGTTVNTVIRYKENVYPTSPTGADGSTLAYNGTDETKLVTGLNPDVNYYFSSWTCANSSGSPNLYQYSDNYDSLMYSLFNGTYNITVRYENRTYGLVDLTTGHNHQFIVYYSSSTEVNDFNKTGEMDGGNDTVGYWDNVNNGNFTINVESRPLFFSFHWNATKTWLDDSGNSNTTNFSCYRVIVPETGQRNITFYIRDDLRVYGDSSIYRNDSLVRYTMSFIDSSGEFIPQNNPYAIIYTYDSENNKQVIHSEYFDASKQIIPWLIYDKRYYIGVKCDTEEFARISTFIPGDDQNPKILIPYQYVSDISFFDLIELDVGRTATGFFVDYQDTTGCDISATLYVWWYSNDTVYKSPTYPKTVYLNSHNWTVVCNTSMAWKYNLKIILTDTDPDDNINYTGTYWLANANGAAVLNPGLESIITVNDINDILQIIFGDSPMYDNEGDVVSWASIALFGFSFVLLVSFGKINAFVGSLSVGIFLMAAGGWVYGAISGIVAVGVFILAISIVGLLGGVDTR